MQRSHCLLLGALGLGLLAGAARDWQIPSAPGETREDFLLYAARSYSESRSGDIFAIPQRYSFLAAHDYAYDGWSHVRIKGQVQHLRHLGIAHGLPWSYDTRIPIVLYGSGFIKAGLVTDAFATQQDLAPTVAALIGAAAPEDARGRVLDEAFKVAGGRRPKAVLTLVFDQGGLENYYEAHPDSYPTVKSLMAGGTFYRRARLMHLDAETAVGHAAIGTGAYPAQHGLVANNFWRRDRGASLPAYDWPDTPVTLQSPTLIDSWNRASGNKAINVSYCYAARAAFGMGGHGRLFARDSHNIVLFYDDKRGRLKTNAAYFDLPGYLVDLSPDAYWQKATNGTNSWLDHQFDPGSRYAKLPVTPSFVDFDTDVFLAILEHEPIGQDEVPDLLYLTLKSTDACAHAFGSESEECDAVFKAQDAAAGRIIKALADKVGQDNFVVMLTADHGGPPLPELHGGRRLLESQLLADLNRRFDRLDNGVALAEYATGTQLFLDDTELARNGVSRDDIKRFLEDYRVAGRPFYFAVFTKDEVRRARTAAGLF